jgi:hypothetical protein
LGAPSNVCDAADLRRSQIKIISPPQGRVRDWHRLQHGFDGEDAHDEDVAAPLTKTRTDKNAQARVCVSADPAQQIGRR